MYKADIVLVDTGVATDHEALHNIPTRGFTLRYDMQSEKIYEMPGYQDEIGHGTAIFYLLHSCCPGADILSIKLELMGDEDSYILQKALEFIDCNVECNIVHLSMGVEFCNHTDALQQVCDRIAFNGTFIVAAFSNLGCVSYPAAFESVIGIDESSDYMRFSDYEYIKHSIVNLRVSANPQRLLWLNNGYQKVSGTSFSSPHATSIIYALTRNKRVVRKELNERLEKGAFKVSTYTQFHRSQLIPDIKRAVVFPFNKETHSIVRFSRELSFELVDVYDTKYLGNIGKSASGLLSTNLQKDFLIKNIDNIDISAFDTLILGHTKRLELMTGIRYLDMLYDLCESNGKQIYSFDQFDIKDGSETNERFFTPWITEKNVPSYLLGKLYCISTPVLCVVGTSAKQGKFTLQNVLRRHFLNAGYKVGQIGTEPSSLLYGFDYTYPMGYNSTVTISGRDHVCVINDLLHKIDMKGVDIILIGAQAGLLAAGITNIDFIPQEQTYFLYGANADGYIMMCNYYDDTDYVARTVRHIESYSVAKVIAIVVFPFDDNFQWSVIGSRRKKVDEEALLFRCKELSDITNKEVFVLDDDGMHALFDRCIEYLS